MGMLRAMEGRGFYSLRDVVVSVVVNVVVNVIVLRL